MKPFDDGPIDLQVNASDLWYMGRVIKTMQELSKEQTP